VYFEEGHAIGPLLQAVCLKLQRLINFFGARRILISVVARDTLLSHDTLLSPTKGEGPLGATLSPTISSGTFGVQPGKGAKPQVSGNGPR
jgi:hypothetical protein